MHIPLLITLIFVVHPIHTEVVANIKSRDEILSFIFVLFSMLVLHNYLKNLHLRELLLASGSWLLALFSKENAVALIFILPLLIPLAASTSRNKKWTIAVVFAGTFIAYALIRLYIQDWSLTFRSEIPLTDNALAAAPDLLHRVIVALALLGNYIWKCFIPYPLISDYSFGYIVDFSLFQWQTILSLTVMILIIAMSVRLRKKMPWVTFGIWWFFITIAIVANVFFLTGATFAERFLFMPSLGIIISSVALLYYNRRKIVISGNNQPIPSLLLPSGKIKYFFILVIVVFSVLTLRRSSDWRNNITLFERDLRVAPEHVKLNYFYAAALLKNLNDDFSISGGEREDILRKAEMHLQKALVLYPPYPDANHRMGNVMNHRGNFSAAIPFFDIAVQGGTNNPDFYSDYGRACIELGNYPKADSLLQLALLLNAEHIPALLNRGVSYARQQAFPDALIQYEKVLRLDKRHFMALKNAGSACGNMSNFEKAIDYFNRAYKINPDDPELNNYLGMTYRHLGDEQTALFYENRFSRLSNR